MGRRARESGERDALRVDRPLVVQLGGKMSVAEAVALLNKNPEVLFAEPDGIATMGSVPNDPDYHRQWHHQNVRSEQAWEVTTGSSNVIVAVLDTGLDYTLAEFAGRVLPGHDYVNNDDDPIDDNGHGTAITGIIAANANNHLAVAGMDWHCRILPCKISDADGDSRYSWHAEAIYDAIDRGAKVFNFSGGGDTDSMTLQAAIDYANSRGAIYVTITHNDGRGVITFPGRLPQCITVGGSLQNDRWAGFSNWGPAIDLIAPADNVFTVNIGGVVGPAGGTSSAAPCVAGVVALLASIDPSLDHVRAEEILRASADDQLGDANDTPGWDQYHGAGRLNAGRAVALASGGQSSATIEHLHAWPRWSRR